MENKTEDITVTGVVASSAGHVSITVAALALVYKQLCWRASARVEEEFRAWGRYDSNRLGLNMLALTCEIIQFIPLFSWKQQRFHTINIMSFKNGHSFGYCLGPEKSP